VPDVKHSLWIGLAVALMGVAVALLVVFRGGQWPLLVVGGVFFLAGVQLVRTAISPASASGFLSYLTAALVCAGFASLGAWIALSGPKLEGGLPGLPYAWNQSLGRALFGLGVLLCAGMAVWFFLRGVRARK
jgi:hypothetical protein